MAAVSAASIKWRAASPLHGFDRGSEADIEYCGHDAERGVRVTATVWRIAVEAPGYMANDVSGNGAKVTGGRWNSPGVAMIYTSASIALATLETLSYLNPGPLPFNRYLIQFDIPDDVWRSADRLPSLPGGWDAIPAGMTSRQIGDAWIAGATSLLLKVPSVIVPDECNILIHPSHPHVADIYATTVRTWLYDPRFFR